MNITMKSRVVAVIAAVLSLTLAAAITLPAAGGAAAPTADVAAKGKGKKGKGKKGKKKVAKSKLYDNYFDPIKLTIKKGTTVKWKQVGSNPHNVTVTKRPKGVKKKPFTSSTMGFGSVFKAKFKKKGTYKFLCTFHVGMDQTVKVKGG